MTLTFSTDSNSSDKHARLDETMTIERRFQALVSWTWAIVKEVFDRAFLKGLDHTVVDAVLGLNYLITALAHKIVILNFLQSTPSFYHLVPPPQFSSPSKHFWRKFWCYHPSWPLKDFFLSFVDSVSIHPINTYIDTYINGRRFNLSQEIHHSKRNHQSEFEPKLADHLLNLSSGLLDDFVLLLEYSL